MATAHPRRIGRASREHRGAKRNSMMAPLLVFFGGAALAVVYVAYILWPRWPSAPLALDAPTLPVTIADAVFNIPPAAIRVPVQRRPGTQERVDLAFLWPSLRPPDQSVKSESVMSSNMTDRLFVTLAISDGTLPPAERVKTIYPRYLDDRISSGPGGLALRPFRDGTPYQGEEILFDPRKTDGFFVRCTREGPAATPGTCLHDRRIGGADVTLRFPRVWLEDWPAVADGIERLLASLRVSGR